MSDFVGNMAREAMADAVATHLDDEAEQRPVALPNLRILARQFIRRGHVIQAMRKNWMSTQDVLDLAAFRELAAEARAKQPVLDAGWAHLSIARAHHVVRMDSWAREFAERLVVFTGPEPTNDR